MPDAFGQKNDSALAIINAGVQSSEDAPFISSGYRFLPGDFVYGTFQITSFARRQASAEALPKISLKYEATLEDQNGLPMAPTEGGEIESELSSEDKDWTPKRRVSFTLPQFVGAGKAQLHIVVKDLLANGEASRNLPIQIGGLSILKTDTLAVQDLVFYRKESDAEALNIAAFNPGSSVFARFSMTGFKNGRQNSYHLVYDVLVLRPDGKPYIQQPHAAELEAENFYPAQYLPGVLQFTTTPNASKGVYSVVLTIHDLVANTTAQSKTAFTLE